MSDRNSSSSASNRLRSAPTWLLHTVDGSLAAAVIVLPWIMGGRHPWGELFLAITAVLAATAWCAVRISAPGQRWTWTRAEPLLLVGLAVVLLQIVPLPTSVHAFLSPTTAEILPLAAGTPSAWNRVSLSPESTRSGLIVFLSYSMLFLVAAQRMRRISDVERLFRWIAISATAMAILGIAQFLTGNGKFLWVYEHPYRDTNGWVQGAYANKNHFAHLMALGLGPLLWWIQHELHAGKSGRLTGVDSWQRRRNKGLVGPLLPMLALGIVLFAALMSLSRGGAIAMLVAATVCVGVYFRKGIIGGRFLGCVAAAALLVAVGLGIHGYRSVAGRLDDLTQGSVNELDKGSGRRDVWLAVAKGTGDFWRLGSGVGSHRELVPMYLDGARDFEYSHAENSFLQIALEAGLPALAVTLAGLALCIYWCIAGMRRASSDATPDDVQRRVHAAMAAVAAGLAASVVHSLFDFVWYIGSCMAITALLASCAFCLYRASQGRQPRTTPRSSSMGRLGDLGTALAVVVVGGWMIVNQWAPAAAAPHWDEYLRISEREENGKLLSESLAVTGDHDDRENANGEAPSDRLAESQVLDRQYEALKRVLSHYPNHHRAQMRMATVQLLRFENAQQQSVNQMPLTQIRDAAVASAAHFQKMGQTSLAQHDRNADAHLSPDEVASDPELVTRFAAIDTDGDSQLNVEELGRLYLDQWLVRAVGENGRLLDAALIATQRGLALCPLQGEGYVTMATLGFLRGGQASTENKTAFLQQAVRVRPYEGQVLFAAGREAMLDQDFDTALKYWKRSFHTARRDQRQLIDLLYARVPPEFFLEHFQPDLLASRQLYKRYSQLHPSPDRPQVLGNLMRYFATKITEEANRLDGLQASRLWIECQQLHAGLGETEAMIECAQRAVETAPDNHYAHYIYGTRLHQVGRLAEAEQQIRRCLAQKPEDKRLSGLLVTIRKARINHEGGAVTARRPAKAIRR